MVPKKISIIHPSRQRPQMAYETYKKWMTQCVHTNEVEYILSVDNDDPTLQSYNWEFKNALDVTFHYNNNRSAIDAINYAAQFAKGNIFIVVSDDFDTFFAWDEFLLEKLKDYCDFIVKTNDGYLGNNWLITLPILDREYYNRFEYIYYPEYKHLWCDTEMTVVGKMLGKIIDLQHFTDKVFKHNHHTMGLMEKDEIAVKNDATWDQGKSLFLERYDADFYINQDEIVFRFEREKFL